MLVQNSDNKKNKLDIKVRGNSTADPSKRAYRLKFGKDEKDKVTGELVKTHKHDLMGGGYAKRNWALLANCFDHSLIRNALTCELGKIIGMPFNPGYCFVVWSSMVTIVVLIK